MRLLPVAVIVGLSATALVVPTASAADPEYQWSDPQTVVSDPSPAVVTDTDVVGALSVAAVTQTSASGIVIEVYYARGDGDWARDFLFGVEDVGSDPGLPDIATDGQGWALVWQRPAGNGSFEVIEAVSLNAGAGFATPPRRLGETSFVAPMPTIDGTLSAGGLRYTATWISAPASASATSVAVSDYTSTRWQAVRTLASYDEATNGAAAGARVAISDNGSAIVGFEVERDGASTLQTITRGPERAGSPWAPLPTPASGLAAAAVIDGPWSLDLAERDASSAAISWSRNVRDDAAIVRYARISLFSDTVDQVKTVATDARVRYLQVASARFTNDVVTWIGQATVTPGTAQPYALKSLAVNITTEETAEFTLASGSVLAPPHMSLGMNGQDQAWVATYRIASTGFSLAQSFASTGVTTSRLWATPERYTVSSGAPNLFPFGISLLVSSDASMLPRAVLADANVSGAPIYNIRASRFEAVPQEPPGPPTNVSATAGNASAMVSWAAPADPGSSAITGYRVTANPGGQTCESTALRFFCNVNGLTNETAYTFTVVAVSDVGAGVPSAPSNSVTPSDQRAPGAPLRVRAVPGNAEAVITWREPNDPGTSPITGYTVTSAPAGPGCTTDPITLTCTIVGLTNGVEYTFAVAAVNAVGVGFPTRSKSITPSPEAAKPLPPSTLIVKAKKKRQVLVRWNSSVSATVGTYSVSVRKAGGGWKRTDVGDVRKKTYRLNAGQRACYRVAAITTIGVRGDWSPAKCVVGKR